MCSHTLGLIHSFQHMPFIHHAHEKKVDVCIRTTSSDPSKYFGRTVSPQPCRSHHIILLLCEILRDILQRTLLSSPMPLQIFAFKFVVVFLIPGDQILIVYKPRLVRFLTTNFLTGMSLEDYQTSIIEEWFHIRWKFHPLID